MSDSTNIMRQYMEAVPRRDFDKIRQLFHPHGTLTRVVTGSGKKGVRPASPLPRCTLPRSRT